MSKYCASCYNYIDFCDCLGNFGEYEHLVDFSVSGREKEEQPTDNTWYFLGPINLLLEHTGELGLWAALKHPKLWTKNPPLDHLERLSIPQSRLDEMAEQRYKSYHDPNQFNTPAETFFDLTPGKLQKPNPWNLDFFDPSIRDKPPIESLKDVRDDIIEKCKKKKTRVGAMACIAIQFAKAGISDALVKFLEDPVLPEFIPWVEIDGINPIWIIPFAASYGTWVGKFIKKWNISPGPHFNWLDQHIIDGTDPNENSIPARPEITIPTPNEASDLFVTSVSSNFPIETQPRLLTYSGYRPPLVRTGSESSTETIPPERPPVLPPPIVDPPGGFIYEDKRIRFCFATLPYQDMYSTSANVPSLGVSMRKGSLSGIPPFPGNPSSVALGTGAYSAVTVTNSNNLGDTGRIGLVVFCRDANDAATPRQYSFTNTHNDVVGGAPNLSMTFNGQSISANSGLGSQFYTFTPGVVGMSIHPITVVLTYKPQNLPASIILNAGANLYPWPRSTATPVLKTSPDGFWTPPVVSRSGDQTVLLDSLNAACVYNETVNPPPSLFMSFIAYRGHLQQNTTDGDWRLWAATEITEADNFSIAFPQFRDFTTGQYISHNALLGKRVSTLGQSLRFKRAPGNSCRSVGIVEFNFN